MLGLKRGIVELVSHQGEWSIIADKTIKELKNVLGDVAIDIQHIGSTSIKSINAKPIIDISVGLKHLDDIIDSKMLKELNSKGYTYHPTEKEEFQRFFKKGTNDIITHHIHAIIYGCEEWNNYLLFRDSLNGNPSWAEKYGDIKNELMSKYKHNRLAYTEGKSQVIKDILKEAELMEMMSKEVEVTIDRPIGSTHPTNPDTRYKLNYGYVESYIGGDGEYQDAYIMGVDYPIKKFVGEIICIIGRKDDVKNKWVVALKGHKFIEPQIKEATNFIEKYFDSNYICKFHKCCGGIIYTKKDGEILFLLINEYKDIWSFPKGHMEQDETEKQTAKREIFEETGLKLDIESCKTYPLDYSYSKCFKKEVLLFPIFIEYIEQIYMNDNCKWFEFSEAVEVLFFDDVREIITEFYTDLIRQGE